MVSWTTVGGGAADDAVPRDYSRYPAYPEYCSTPSQIGGRAVPGLRDDVPVGETRLVHVTAVTRHGARTPLAHDACWDGFWTTSLDTGTWDCDLTTWMATPAPRHIQEEEGEKKQQDADAEGASAMFLFEKRYDALMEADGSIPNRLNGTCEFGQLLLKGYDQMLANGGMLREAYLYGDGTANGEDHHDVRMRLMRGDTYKTAQQIRFRSDDEQRTLVSGQVLLRGMLSAPASTSDHPVIDLHTADLARDIIHAKGDACPRLEELRQEAEESSEFRALNESSAEAKRLRDFMKESFGLELENPRSCMMTAICNDLELPDGINDYRMLEGEVIENQDPSSSPYDEKFGRDRFQRLVEWSDRKKTFHVRFNDAAYAKLASGPIWAEIMEHGMKEATETASPDDPSVLRFSLISGHDSTIAALMSSLGPTVWNDTDVAPFASMMLLEIHEIVGGTNVDRTVFRSDKAFRLVYNGRVLTSAVKGCDPHADLCDVAVLLNRVRPFATRTRRCETSSAFEIAKNGGASWSSSTAWKAPTKALLTTPGGVFLVFVVATVSALVGCIATLWYLTRTDPIRFEQLALEELDNF